MSDNEHYYENKSLWEKEKYLSGPEFERFQESISMLSSDVGSLLDVGAGNGAFLRFLEEDGRINNLSGVERSSEAINRKLCDTDISQGDIQSLTHEKRSFDIVSSQEVIEHLPFGVYEAGLKELERVAKKYILISVPYREKRQNVSCPYCSCKFNQYFHLRSFDEQSMKGLFSDFKVKSIKTVGVNVEYLFHKQIKEFYYTMGRNFPVNACCPQCGFSKQVESGAAVGGGGKKRIIQNLLPHRKVPKWMIVLYERIDN